MTARERVLASRLIQKIDGHSDYAKRIGLQHDFGVVTPSANKPGPAGNQRKSER